MAMSVMPAVRMGLEGGGAGGGGGGGSAVGGSALAKDPKANAQVKAAVAASLAVIVAPS
jgi:hypothetical protein